MATLSEEVKQQMTNANPNMGTMVAGTVPNPVDINGNPLSQEQIVRQFDGLNAVTQMRDLERSLERVQNHLRGTIDEEYRIRRLQANASPLEVAGMDITIMNLRSRQNDLRQEEVKIMQQTNIVRQQIGQNQLNNVQAQPQGQLHTWTADFQQRYFNAEFFSAQPTLSPVQPKLVQKPKPAPANDPEILKEAYKNLLVAKVQLDSQKRVIITTKPIYIKKKEWKKKQKVGKYEILIDFSRSNFYDAIQIKNRERTIRGYDHPHIDSWICWGTMAKDLEADYNRRDFYEIVTDCIDFIISPNDEETMRTRGWQLLIDKGEKKKRSFIKKGEKVITIKK